MLPITCNPSFTYPDVHRKTNYEDNKLLRDGSRRTTQELKLDTVLKPDIILSG